MYLARQRDHFVAGTPSPDFGGGAGESAHVGRVSVEHVAEYVAEDGARAMGVAEWDADAAGLTPGQRVILDRANKILGFYE
jgi:hypothetical protein